MNEKINLFITIRKWLLFCSKVLGIIVCIYFLVNAKHYEISWNLLVWAMPSVALKINTFLSQIGMYLLIVPLSIIIVSIIIPNNITLNIIASFFGVSGTLITITKGLLNETLSNVYNMKFFVITKILEMEQKRDIFTLEFKRIINEFYSNNLELFQLLKESLNPKYFPYYNQHLKDLSNILEIKNYTSQVVLSIVKVYEESKVIPPSSPNYFKYIFGTIAVIGVIFLGASVIRYLFIDTDSIKKGAGLLKDTVNLSGETTEQITKLAEDLANTNSNLNQLTTATQLLNNTVNLLSKLPQEIISIKESMEVLRQCIQTVRDDAADKSKIYTQAIDRIQDILKKNNLN